MAHDAIRGCCVTLAIALATAFFLVLLLFLLVVVVVVVVVSTSAVEIKIFGLLHVAPTKTRILDHPEQPPTVGVGTVGARKIFFWILSCFVFGAMYWVFFFFEIFLC
jgi:hypothetical protein